MPDVCGDARKARLIIRLKNIFGITNNLLAIHTLSLSVWGTFYGKQI